MYFVWNMWSEKLAEPNVNEIEEIENIILCGMRKHEKHYIDNKMSIIDSMTLIDLKS